MVVTFSLTMNFFWYTFGVYYRKIGAKSLRYSLFYLKPSKTIYVKIKTKDKINQLVDIPRINFNFVFGKFICRYMYNIIYNYITMCHLFGW